MNGKPQPSYKCFDDYPEYLTKAHIQQILHLRSEKVTSLFILQSKIEPIKISPRRFLYLKEDLAKILKRKSSK